MKWLLDTNIVSELVRPRPDGTVAAWLGALPPLDLALSVITLGEIEKGIHLLRPSQRRTILLQWAHAELPRQFTGRLLSIDAAVTVRWGQLAANVQRSGHHLPVIDGMLLATAHAHSLTFVTRSVSDCAGRGVPVYDPWTDTLHP